MFLNRKNQHYENDYTTKPNLQIQCDIPITLPMAFFTELEQNISQSKFSVTCSQKNPDDLPPRIAMR